MHLARTGRPPKSCLFTRTTNGLPRRRDTGLIGSSFRLSLFSYVRMPLSLWLSERSTFPVCIWPASACVNFPSFKSITTKHRNRDGERAASPPDTTRCQSAADVAARQRKAFRKGLNHRKVFARHGLQFCQQCRQNLVSGFSRRCRERFRRCLKNFVVPVYASKHQRDPFDALQSSDRTRCSTIATSSGHPPCRAAESEAIESLWAPRRTRSSQRELLKRGRALPVNHGVLCKRCRVLFFSPNTSSSLAFDKQL